MSGQPLTDNRGMNGHAPAGDPAPGGEPRPANRFGVIALDTLALAGAYAGSVAVIVLLYYLTRTTRPEFDFDRVCCFSEPRSPVALVNAMNDELDHARGVLLSAIGPPFCVALARGPAIRNPFVRNDPTATETPNADLTSQSIAATPTTGAKEAADGEGRIRIRFGPKSHK